jgi:hypothetical protein
LSGLPLCCRIPDHTEPRLGWGVVEWVVRARGRLACFQAFSPMQRSKCSPNKYGILPKNGSESKGVALQRTGKENLERRGL